MHKTFGECVHCRFLRQLSFDRKTKQVVRKICPKCRRTSECWMRDYKSCCKQYQCSASDWLCKHCDKCSRHCKCTPLLENLDDTASTSTARSK